MLVHYPSNAGLNFSTSQIVCEPGGGPEGAPPRCGAPTPLGQFLRGAGAGVPPLFAGGALGIAAGPGLGAQLSAPGNSALDGRLVFSGHHGQVDLTWFSDDHGATWTLSPAMFGNLTAFGCYRVAGCFDEPAVAALPGGVLQINMRNDSLTADPSDPARLVAPIRHPRTVATSLDGGVSFGPPRQVPSLLEPPGGCQGSSLAYGGALLFSGPAGACPNRTQLTVRRSVDDGMTYPSAFEVWPGQGGYSCLVPLGGSSGGVGIAFEREAADTAACTGGGCRISFAHLPADFVHGRAGAFFPISDVSLTQAC